MLRIQHHFPFAGAFVLTIALLIGSILMPRAYAPTSIAFDAAASTFCQPCVATTLSWSHTVGSGSSRILVVGVSINAPDVAVATISYSSSPLTMLVNPGSYIALYYLLNPTIGTATVTVTFTDTRGFGYEHTGAAAGSVSYFNVAGVGSSSSTSGEGSSASITVTANAGDLVVDVLSAGAAAIPLTAASGQTIRWLHPTVGAGSDKIASSPVTMMTWNLKEGSYSGAWDLIAAVLLHETTTTSTVATITTASPPQTTTAGQPAVSALVPGPDSTQIVTIVAVGVIIGLAVYALSKRRRIGRPISVAGATQAGLFEVSVSVPSVGKTVTLEVAPNHTIGSLVESLTATLDLSEDKAYAVEYEGRLISQADFGKSLATLGIKEGSKLSLRVVE